MEHQQTGSKAYLFSIVMVAVLGGLLFGYDTAVRVCRHSSRVPVISNTPM